MAEAKLSYEEYPQQKNWYAPQAKREFRSWSASSQLGQKELIGRFSHRRGHDLARWRVVFRFPCRDDVRSSTTEKQFRKLAQEWKTETRFASFSNQLFLVKSYQRIIGLGPKAVPFILSELQNEPGHWFWALAAITGENPVEPDDAGDVQAMREAWLEWGMRQGHL